MLVLQDENDGGLLNTLKCMLILSDVALGDVHFIQERILLFNDRDGIYFWRIFVMIFIFATGTN